MLDNNTPPDQLGSAVLYQNPNSDKKFKPGTGRTLYIMPAALNLLKDLNGYDQHQVCKGIESLASIPSPEDGLASSLRPDFLKAKPASAIVFNYIIKYGISSSAIIINSIKLNHAILGAQQDKRLERSALYTAERIGNKKFSAQSTLDEIRDLERKSWKRKSNVTKVRTRHAAVNGMLNEHQKAVWLMGVHADIAFDRDEFNEFTLFHNPSESFKLDFYESVKDNLGFTTENAKQLSAILRQVQQDGQPVKWVVHSQGGIIFKQAINHHVKNFSGQMLDMNSVVFHSGGNNKKVTDKLLKKVGIRKEAPDRDNPFDIVSNMAGGNHLGPRSIKRSLKFLGKVKNDNFSTAESPHTLPFLSLEAYHHFLVMAGDNKSAGQVDNYMKKLNSKH